METAEKRFPFGLKQLSLILILVGLIVSGYLSYVKLLDEQIICTQGEQFNCDLVQNSVYANLMGIPIAYLGFLTYVVLGALLLLESRIGLLEAYGKLLFFAITLFAFLFSMWLIYVQAVLLQSFCIWCLIHETTMTLLFIISGIVLWRDLKSIDT